MPPHKAPLNTIAGLSTAVFDTGRRGMPRPGCDCEQCFGYCLKDTGRGATQEQAGGFRPRGARNAPLDFDK